MKRQDTTGLWVVVDSSTGQIVSRAEQPQTAINIAVSRGVPVENQQALLAESQVILRQEAQANASRDQGSGTASSGTIAAESARARGEDATTQAPPTQPTTVVQTQGRISPQDIETGTNAPVRTISQTQGVPPVTGTTPVFGLQPDQNQGAADSQRVSAPQPGGTVGVGAGNDDRGTRSQTQQIIRTVAANKVTPQGNVLDQYVTYTYNIGWYIMEPGTYQRLLESQKKSLVGMQLLAQSGGAPTGAAAQPPVNSSDAEAQPGGFYGQTAPSAIGARNQFFGLDYYIDNVELESLIQGPQTGSAHNVTNLRFTVTEPYGITLVNNLWQAVNSVYKERNMPYSLAQFCLVVRFYGYDSNGNLVQVGRDRNSATDSRAVVEKFYPFTIKDIKFRVQSRLVEYDIEGIYIAHSIANGTNYGIIKENIELTGATVSQVLGDKAQARVSDDGRATQPQAPQGTTVAPEYSADGRFQPDDTPSPFQVGA